jgi:hypothetical protein
MGKKIGMSPHDILQILTALAPFISVTVLGILNYLLLRSHRKTLDVMRKDRERPQILELCERIIVPFIKKLRKEIKFLEEGDYGWFHRGRRIENISKLDAVFEDEIILLNELKRKFPDINEKIEKRNNLIPILEKRLDILDKSICESNFKQKCLTLINEHLKKHPEEKGTFSEPLSVIEYFMDYVINHKRELGQAYVYHNFWREYGMELLEVRNEKGVKEQIEDITILSTNLKQITESLLLRLEEIEEKFRKDYNLSVKEVWKREAF